MAHLHVNWLAPVKVRRTLIGGSRKMVVYDDLEPSEKIKVYDKGITLNGNGEHAGDGDGNGQSYAMLVGYRTGDVWSPQIELTEALSTELGNSSTASRAAGRRPPMARPACASSACSRPRPSRCARRAVPLNSHPAGAPYDSVSSISRRSTALSSRKSTRRSRKCSTAAQFVLGEEVEPFEREFAAYLRRRLTASRSTPAPARCISRCSPPASATATK